MVKKKFSLIIDLHSPMHISSGSTEQGYIDKFTVKKDGKPYIPASSIKGKVRDNFYTVLANKLDSDQAKQITEEIFGGEGFSPSNIMFEDLTTNSTDTGIRFGIAVDRYRQIAKDGALFNQETAEKTQFMGNVTVYLSNKNEKYQQELLSAFSMIEVIGAGKSQGLGFCKVQVQEVTA